MAASPSKETTPAAGEKKEEKTMSVFTEKEQKLIIVAFSCLKSGPPEIDYAKFEKAGDFNTMKTAQNTWGKIKAKLAKIAPKTDDDAAAEGDEAEDGAEALKTPKTPKAKATPKKRAPKKAEGDDDDDAEEGASPKKKARRTPVRKAKKEVVAAEDVKDEAMEEDDE
ncbi:hypothetical protein LTR08_005975 [Meristemomyces frigidus]|nr:hypothetical protein LTR08_005975 [Meristemomyces frigidus]